MSFITDLAPYAQKVGKKYNVLPSLILAQASLESNFGQSGLAIKGKNLFGIKGSYQGQCVNMPTTEYQNGEPIRINAPFRKYPSWGESMEDLCLLYSLGVSWDRSKYHNIIGEKDIQKACEHVQADGYATDPHYTSKLMGIVSKYNLTQYDNKTVPVPSAPTAEHTVSIVDYLKSKNIDSSFANRKKLAASHGINNYTGTAAQNIQLLHAMTTVTAKPSKKVYIVKSGDSLSKILGTNDKAKIQEVCKANGIKDKDFIKVGQKIFI